MRFGFFMVAGFFAGCAPQSSGVFQPVAYTPEERARIAAMYEDDARRRAAAEVALTPGQRAQREFDAAKAARENELLERAVSASPDYTAVVTRAAVANVDGAMAIPPAPGERRVPVNARAREAAIRAEEARLSEAVEVRRRQRLGEQAAQRQGQQDRQMAAQCIALGQQIEASMYSPRSFLNLEGAIAGAQARDNCWANYQRNR